MRRLSIIGIGAGNPDHITVQAIKALRAEALDVRSLQEYHAERAARTTGA
jgi:precorrin-6A synthase